MKIPKLFIPEKSLEEKTKSLLEAKPPHKTDEEKYSNIYAELKNEFPNFTNYITSIYPNLEICKVKQPLISPPCISDDEWHFYIRYSQLTLEMHIGMIKKYTREQGANTSEYGYEAEVFIRNQKHMLRYRKGYHTFDSMNVIITTNDPLRLDEHKEIPFP